MTLRPPALLANKTIYLFSCDPSGDLEISEACTVKKPNVSKFSEKGSIADQVKL